MEAFYRLSPDRHYHVGGAGNIPWTAINEYAKRYHIEGDDFEIFHDIIHRMDSEYLRVINPKPTDGPTREVALTDADGVRALLKRAAKSEDD